MSREAVGKDYYLSKGGQLPIRWTAPECLEEHKFSEQSDVWSFGIMLYEMWTKAETPYVGWRNEKVWVQVLGGYRLPCPVNCPVSVHNLMTECWKEAGERPGFGKICQIIDDLDVVTSTTHSSPAGNSTAEIVSKAAPLTYMIPDEENLTSQDANSLSKKIKPEITGKSTLLYMVPDSDTQQATKNSYLEINDESSQYSKMKHSPMPAINHSGKKSSYNVSTESDSKLAYIVCERPDFQEISIQPDEPLVAPFKSLSSASKTQPKKEDARK